jgi:8-oxo-dGTP diphosphatase
VILLEKVSIINPDNIRRGPEQVRAAICYIFNGDYSLMIKRKKEPFMGYIVAPGGRFEEGETPFMCIEREIWEETGLRIKDYRLKIVTSELGPRNYNWILYLFVCTGYEGEVRESDEGELCWVHKDRLTLEKMSDIDKKMLPYVMDDKRYFMKLKYDKDKKCTIESMDLFGDDYIVTK